MNKRIRWLALGAAMMFGGSALAHANAPALRSSALQVDPDGFVFVVNPDSDSVTRLTPLSSGAQTKQWEAPVGDYPRTLTLGDFDGYIKADMDKQRQIADGAKIEPH